MILAFETATDVCSVAFQNREGEILEKRIQGRSVHSDHLFLYTKDFTEEYQFSLSDLDALLISNGPGSYTGLRIAASAVKGMLFGLNVDLYACGTLTAMAAAAENGRVHAVLDARRTHFYHQAFEKTREQLIRQSEPRVVEISDFERMLKDGDQIIGTGLERLSAGILDKHPTMDSDNISAINLIRLFEDTGTEHFIKTLPEELDPLYLSNHQVNNTKT